MSTYQQIDNPIKIVIRGIGHCPAFKNKKIICGKRLITAPKARKWMESCTKLITSQLKSKYQTIGGETSMEHWLPSAIASWPLDDNCKVITQINVRVRKVPKGEEGVTFYVEKFSPIL